MAGRHEEGCHEKKYPRVFSWSQRKDYHRTIEAGVARGTVFQDIRPGAGLKTGDVVGEKFGGAFVGRLHPSPSFVQNHYFDASRRRKK